MKAFSVILLLSLIAGHLVAEDQKDWITTYKPISIEGRFAVYTGPSAVVLDAKLRSHAPKTYLEAIQYFGPAFIHNLSGGGMWEWHFDDAKVLRSGGPSPGKTLSDALDASLVDSNFGIIVTK